MKEKRGKGWKLYLDHKSIYETILLMQYAPVQLKPIRLEQSPLRRRDRRPHDLAAMYDAYQ